MQLRDTPGERTWNFLQWQPMTRRFRHRAHRHFDLASTCTLEGGDTARSIVQMMTPLMSRRNTLDETLTRTGTRLESAGEMFGNCCS